MGTSQIFLRVAHFKKNIQANIISTEKAKHAAFVQNERQFTDHGLDTFDHRRVCGFGEL